MEMNMHSALPMQTSSGNCYNELKVPESYTSPLPVLANPFFVSSSREMIANSLQMQADPIVSHIGSSSSASPFVGVHITTLIGLYWLNGTMQMKLEKKRSSSMDKIMKKLKSCSEESSEHEEHNTNQSEASGV